MFVAHTSKASEMFISLRGVQSENISVSVGIISNPS